MKKIGTYLLENKICEEALLRHALEQQTKLQGEGVFKPIGEILTESFGIAVQDLNEALFHRHCDIVSTSTLFNQISTEAVKQMVLLAEHQILPANSLIFNEGDKSDFFFIITSGQVTLCTSVPGDREICTIQYGTGDGFGEIAFLTGESHKNFAKTLAATGLLALSKKHLERLCTDFPEISDALIRYFASRLVQKDADILQASKKERAYQQFVSQQDTLYLPEVIGESRTIIQLRKQIEQAAQNPSPVLIFGEAGVESIVAASTIHKNGPTAAEPFLSMDSENISLEGYGAIGDAESGMLQLEMAQCSVLFGSEEGALCRSMTRGLGLLEICRQGTVVIKNIDKLTHGAQSRLCDYLVKGRFVPVGGQETIASQARIIATTSRDLARLTEEKGFSPELFSLLQANSMTVPPIRKRKSDLRLLVDFFIILECFKVTEIKLIKGISPEAYHRIMAYDWPGNMDELQIVVRRAINLAKGDYLLPEDIFLGLAPPAGKHTLNLLQFAGVRNLFNSRAYPVAAQLVTVAAFSFIILMAFAGSQLPDRNVSLLLVWGMWEPLLFFSWFVGGRIWCAVCPMGAINDLLNRMGNKKFKVPAFIHDHGIYLGAMGLGVIIFLEVASDMTYSPRATGGLLLSITFFAVLSGLFFERRVWCRYLCPLGMLGATYAGCSLIEWRANNSICNSTCQDNTCYKGDKGTRGCPLYQGPFSLHSNQNCILCGRCTKLCPNDSPVLNLRVPGHELWATLQPDRALSIFVPVILATQLFRGTEHLPFIQNIGSERVPTWSIYAALLLAATVLSFSYAHLAGGIAFGPLQNGSIRKNDLFIHAIIPLAFACELAYQIRPLLTRFGHFFPTLGRQFSLDWAFLDFFYQVQSAKPWQIFFILIGMAVSRTFLKVLAKNHQKIEERTSKNQLKNLPILFLGGIYIWMFIVQ